jgi:hypothetical protein
LIHVPSERIERESGVNLDCMVKLPREELVTVAYVRLRSFLDPFYRRPNLNVMLKKTLWGVGTGVLLFVLFAVYGLFIATPKSPPNTVGFERNGLEVQIDYPQPYKKGRLIFGEESEGALQPFGKYWRLGANGATEITINKDVRFAGEPIKAGTYRMYAGPGKTSFEVTLNSEADVFFAIRDPAPCLDILTVVAPVTLQSSVTEMFTINISEIEPGARVDFVWDKTQFTVPIPIP